MYRKYKNMKTISSNISTVIRFRVILKNKIDFVEN